jgi:hypothetical protein
LFCFFFFFFFCFFSGPLTRNLRKEFDGDSKNRDRRLHVEELLPVAALWLLFAPPLPLLLLILLLLTGD